MEYRKPLWYGDDIKESKKTMKKFVAIIIAVLLFSTAACGKEIEQAETTAENATESIQISEKLMQITISAVEQSEEAKTESDNGGGYTSQTEEWVDVEAMEAEIIAKYGEAEITEDVTRAQEESTVPEETETQTETAA